MFSAVVCWYVFYLLFQSTLYSAEQYDMHSDQLVCISTRSLSPIPLYHTSSSCVICGQKWLCHTVYDKTKVFLGASYPVTSTAKPCICIRSQKTVPNNLVGRCRHNHTAITPVHAHQKIPLFFIIKRMTQQFIFPKRKKNVFPYWNSEYHTLYHTPN